MAAIEEKRKLESETSYSDLEGDVFGTHGGFVTVSIFQFRPRSSNRVLSGSKLGNGTRSQFRGREEMQGCGERMQMADKLVNDLFVIFSALAQETKKTLEKSVLLIAKRGFHTLGNREIEQ